jgi:hypothetical protein
MRHHQSKFLYDLHMMVISHMFCVCVCVCVCVFFGLKFCHFLNKEIEKVLGNFVSLVETQLVFLFLFFYKK